MEIWNEKLFKSFPLAYALGNEKKREREKKGKKEIVEKFVTTFYVHKSFMEKKERKKKRWKRKEKFVELIYFAKLTE